MRVFTTARQRARELGAVTALFLLAACATQASSPPPPPGDGASGACNVEPAQSGVGQPYADALGAELQAKAGAKVLRVIRPGQAVTMDFRDDRLNVELDAAGKVKRVSCG
jgi:hypothetical protein